jgi:hypothetical protein
MSETPTTTIVAATTILDEEVADEDSEAAEETVMIRTITKKKHVAIMTEKDTIPHTARHSRKMEMKTQTWFQKRILKYQFQSSIKEMLTKRENQKNEKDSTKMDEESLDMNVFHMFTGKHNEFVSKNCDDISNRLMSLINVI